MYTVFGEKAALPEGEVCRERQNASDPTCLLCGFGGPLPDGLEVAVTPLGQPEIVVGAHQERPSLWQEG